MSANSPGGLVVAKQNYYGKKELKFLKKMPLNNIERPKKYDKRFIFNSNPKTGVN